MVKYCIYSHAAVPPANIKLEQWYALEELKERFTLDEIKLYFIPANFSLSELEPKIKKTITE